MDIKYKNDKFQFIYRTSAIIYNSDKSRILLFYGDDREYYMLPGGKVQELEQSKNAIKREIKEELGYDNLEYNLIGVSEEILEDKGLNVHQITLIYESLYNGEISDESFKSIETDWINFKWIKISELKKYKIHPKNIDVMFNNEEKIKHIIDDRINVE